MAELRASGSLCPLKHVSGGAFVIGCFEHESETGTTAAIVMNYEVNYNLFADIEFTVATTEVRTRTHATL